MGAVSLAASIAKIYNSIDKIKWFYEIYEDRKKNKQFEIRYRQTFGFISWLLNQVDELWVEFFKKGNNNKCERAHKKLEKCVKQV